MSTVDAGPHGSASSRPAWVVTVVCAMDDAEALTDLAWSLDAIGVAETFDASTPAIANLIIGVADAATAAQLADTLRHATGVTAIESAEARNDWVETWRAGASPVVVGPFTVRLPEHAAPSGTTVTTDEGTLDLVIEPGVTFGYSHPSTLLAIELLGRLHAAPPRVLDIGAGSGVLAIAAALLGATTVAALDIDPDAVTACRANAVRNGVEMSVDRLDALAPDASGRPPLVTDGGYDLVLANVTAAISTALAPVIRATLAPGGRIVLSGILVDQELGVVAAHAPARPIARVEGDGWVGLMLS